ncbi:Hypothetical protein LUCI_2024 [Lucifera butyrica]|uniref:Uncharacterized protein n=1 Tax=Lucifera butyrica TaxID=1351585 RepID=A0A498RCA9_9FIRM|nr:hypothetical protein [Lucifera butyrica]VBB06788.1 Hypothetical protein LUCI_2024 [Lucifera butyrica]
MVWRKFEQYLMSSTGFYTALFVGLYLASWGLNGIHYTKLDLTALKDLYIWLMTQLNATHAVNSIWNSPKGQPPGL